MGGRGSSSGMNSIRPLTLVKTVPRLEGTEKQVSWARSIRQEVLRDIRSGFNWMPDGRPTTYMNYLFSTEKIQELFSEYSGKPNVELIKHLQDSYKRYSELTKETSAKFWIDNRIDGIKNAGNNKLYERVFGFTEKELRKRRKNW